MNDNKRNDADRQPLRVRPPVSQCDFQRSISGPLLKRLLFEAIEFESEIIERLS